MSNLDTINDLEIIAEHISKQSGDITEAEMLNLLYELKDNEKVDEDAYLIAYWAIIEEFQKLPKNQERSMSAFNFAATLWIEQRRLKTASM